MKKLVASLLLSTTITSFVPPVHALKKRDAIIGGIPAAACTGGLMWYLRLRGNFDGFLEGLKASIGLKEFQWFAEWYENLDEKKQVRVQILAAMVPTTLIGSITYYAMYTHTPDYFKKELSKTLPWLEKMQADFFRRDQELQKALQDNDKGRLLEIKKKYLEQSRRENGTPFKDLLRIDKQLKGRVADVMKWYRDVAQDDEDFEKYKREFEAKRDKLFDKSKKHLLFFKKVKAVYDFERGLKFLGDYKAKKLFGDSSGGIALLSDYRKTINGTLTLEYVPLVAAVQFAQQSINEMQKFVNIMQPNTSDTANKVLHNIFAHDHNKNKKIVDEKSKKIAQLLLKIRDTCKVQIDQEIVKLKKYRKEQFKREMKRRKMSIKEDKMENDRIRAESTRTNARTLRMSLDRKQSFGQVVAEQGIEHLIDAALKPPR